MQALRIAATGMMAQTRNTEIIANNLANMNTTAFQRSRADFSDLLYKTIRRPESTASQAGELINPTVFAGMGVQVASSYRINEPGALTQTSGSFDLAIRGDGYFSVQLPNGDLAYTRAGRFQVNQDGILVTAEGMVVDPGVSIPPTATDIIVNNSGEILAKLPGQDAPSNIGSLQLANFPNPAGLEAEGNNLFVETDRSGAPLVGTPGADGYGEILQGYIETSNVNPIDEITTMIKAQRAYDMNSKVMSAADQMMAPSRS